jgi:NAD(P)-dependent dehydrogenase (short-subunit alcohol dehydrogenase family)
MVTGGSRGLGRSMALALADVGADIIITGRNAGHARRHRRRDPRLGRKAWTIAADMGAPAGMRESVRSTRSTKWARSTSSSTMSATAKKTCRSRTNRWKVWQRLVDLNLTSCFIGTKLVGKAMLERGKGGRIINIASISAIIANRGIAGRHYETAKAAVLHFTRCAAADWAPHGITVNAICPGLFMTDANKQWNKTRPDVIQAIVANIPMGRTGEPEEIGPLAVYLASPAAAYVTGAAYVIDGGYTVW